MRILFAGTPEFALPSLQAIHEHSELVAVLTNPDRVSGRSRKLRQSPVKQYAEAVGLPVLQPERLDAAAREAVREYAPDLLAVAAYGKIFGPKFLAIFAQGGINLHPSLLPRYRGPAPIPAAILAGDHESGISIQQIALEMDAGDILVQEPFPISPQSTTQNLSEYSARRGAELMLQAIDQLEAGAIKPRPQNANHASYCRLIKKEDALINWQLSAAEIEQAVRAYLPWPLAHTHWEGRGLNILAAAPLESPLSSDNIDNIDNTGGDRKPGRVLGVDKKRGILVETGEGILALQSLQLQARKVMDWRSFINGNQGIITSLLGGSISHETNK